MINFPTSIDTLINPIATDAVDTVDHAAQHANANDAIEALEAKVGVNGSSVVTSHDYKLSGVTGADKAVSKTGIETLTNKTLTQPVIAIIKPSASNTQNLPDADSTLVDEVTTQTLANKTLTTPTISSFINANHNHQDAAGGGQLTEDALNLSNVATNDVSVTKHGFVPIAPNTGNQFLKDTGAWAAIPGIGELTLEANQGNEALSIRDVVYIEDGQGFSTPETTQISQTTGSTRTYTPYFNPGVTAEYMTVRQSFQIPVKTAVKSIAIKIGRAASGGSGATHIDIYADNAGALGALLATSASYTPAGTGTFESIVTYTFTTGTYLSPNTTYWIVFVGYANSVVPYLIYANSDVYADGHCEISTDNGANWTAPGGDIYMVLKTSFYSKAGNIKKADANAAGLYATTIGFSINDYAEPDGNTNIDSYVVSVQTDGVIGGFTGLTAGAIYYLQDTPGAIGTSVGTNTVKVGVAISTTELLIRIA